MRDLRGFYNAALLRVSLDRGGVEHFAPVPLASPAWSGRRDQGKVLHPSAIKTVGLGFCWLLLVEGKLLVNRADG